MPTTVVAHRTLYMYMYLCEQLRNYRLYMCSVVPVMKVGVVLVLVCSGFISEV